MILWLAALLRHWADWLDPPPVPVPSLVDVLMPVAREAIVHAETMSEKGPIRWLCAMRAMEKTTGAKRRHINAAIDRAVLERYGD